MCYMCYMGLTRQAAEPPQSPGSLPPHNAYLVHVGDAMCIVHRLLYHIAHIAHGAGEEWRFSGLPCKSHIAHIAHIARSPETVGVQRVWGHIAHIAHIAWS